MTSIILRRSSCLVQRPTLAAIETILHHHRPSSATGLVVAHRNGDIGGQVRSFSTIREVQPEGTCGIQARRFHVKTGPLGYRASAVLQASYAVDDYSYDESSKRDAADEGLEISKLDISPEIVSALAKKGITKLFPIQRAVLEPAMQGRDMIGRARTGTGKTLAFGIPIMDKIIRYNAKHGRGRNPLALVLAPTRELAKQVDKEFYESAPNLDTICVYGGTPISQQMRQLDYGVDIAVGTPGRVIDLIKRGALNLSEVQFIVLDEADQMLQVGFQEDVETILESLPKKRQSLMFSATMPSWIRKLTQNYLKDPVTIDLVGESDQKLPDGITLYSIASDMYGKGSIIGSLITEHAKGGKCIVFTQTKRDADRLAYAMGRNYKCEALHGDISQGQRERTLSGFRDGHFNILVATDVAARGLDIPNVDLIVHYELPSSSEIFVHRSGRTGRAGKKGTAILVYTSDQTRAVRTIERDVGCKFSELPRIKVEGGDADMFAGIGSGGGGRFGQYGGMRDRRPDDSFGRFGGSGSGRSGFARSGGYGDNAKFGGFNSGRSGSSGGFGQFGSGFGSSSSQGGNFGGSGSSTRSSDRGDFGRSGRSSSFGEFGGSGRSSNFGDFGRSGQSRRYGNFGSSHPSPSSQSLGGSDDSNSSRFGSFGDNMINHDQHSDRKPF